MAKIGLELSEATIATTRALAEERHTSIESVIEDKFAPTLPEAKIPGWGLLADEPEVYDAIMETIKERRGWATSVAASSVPADR